LGNHILNTRGAINTSSNGGTRREHTREQCAARHTRRAPLTRTCLPACDRACERTGRHRTCVRRPRRQSQGVAARGTASGTPCCCHHSRRSNSRQAGGGARRFAALARRRPEHHRARLQELGAPFGLGLRHNVISDLPLLLNKHTDYPQAPDFIRCTTVAQPHTYLLIIRSTRSKYSVSIVYWNICLVGSHTALPMIRGARECVLRRGRQAAVYLRSGWRSTISRFRLAP
jgi:hypothetical protein